MFDYFAAKLPATDDDWFVHVHRLPEIKFNV